MFYHNRWFLGWYGPSGYSDPVNNVTVVLHSLDYSDLLGKSLEMFIWNRSGLIYSVLSLLSTKDTNNT